MTKYDIYLLLKSINNQNHDIDLFIDIQGYQI